MGLLMLLLLTGLAWWLVARFLLDGEDLSRYDLPASAPVNDAPSQENDQVLAQVSEFARSASETRGRDRLRHLREAMDGMGDAADLTGVEITALTVAGRPAEWVTAPSAQHGWPAACCTFTVEHSPWAAREAIAASPPKSRAAPGLRCWRWTTG